MSHIGKVYERILEKGLRGKIEQILSETQSEFRPGWGTTDQISAIRVYL